MMRLIIACALVSLSACAGAGPSAITSVTVRDANFVVVKELTAAELETFNHLWNNKVKISESFSVSDKDHYKLDINGGADPGRWLYKVNGSTSELDPMLQPVFKLQSVEAFNRLIGATS